MLRGWKTRLFPGVWIVQTSSYQEKNLLGVCVGHVFGIGSVRLALALYAAWIVLDVSLELNLINLHLLSAQCRLC